MMSGLDVLVNSDDPVELVITLKGELDLSTTDHLDRRVAHLGSQHQRVVLDMSGVEFMDSTGLNAIIKLHRSMAQAGRAVELRAPSAVVRTVLEVCGLERHFGLADAE